MRFTTLSYLLAMVMAIAAMPLDVFQVCRRGIGTIALSPWQRVVAAVQQRVRSLLRLWRTWFGALTRPPEWAAALAILVILVLASSVHSELLAVAPVLVGNLKLYRDNAADIDRRIAENAAEAQQVAKEIREHSDTVAKACKADNREMSEDERKKLTGLQGRQRTNAELKTSLLQEKASNATLLADAEAQNEAERRTPAVTDADEEAARGRIRVRDRVEDDPKKGFKTHREYLNAVMAHGRGFRMDERLKPLHQKPQATAGSDEAGTYSDPHGGFLVPEAFSPTLLALTPEDDPTAGRTRPFPMSAPVVGIPARVDKNHTTSVSGGLTVTRRPETVAGTSSRHEFEKVTLRATSLFGLSFATEEIMTDSPISFVALLASSFSQEFGAKALDEKLNGSGVGEPEGILSSPALVSVAKEAGQPGLTINYDNIKKMRSRCWGYQRAIWMANHDCMPDLMSLVQIVGTGGAPIYQPSAQEDRPDLLLGRPIFYTEYCKTLGTVGDLVCVNWFEWLDATYQPLQSAESMHVRFVEHERAFKFWLRNDGRGWWRSAMTPKNSTKTMSPFVALATRA